MLIKEIKVFGFQKSPAPIVWKALNLVARPVKGFCKLRSNKVEESMAYKTHLFICTNGPDKEGRCGSKGSEDLRKNLKDRCKQAFGKDVRINSSGCLGHCEQGIAAVLYPKGQWFFDLSKKEDDLLFKAVQKSFTDKPIEIKDKEMKDK